MHSLKRLSAHSASSLQRPLVFCFVACCVGFLGIVGCGTTNSTISISEGERFVLGGNQSGGFQVELHNVGEGPVEIATLDADNEMVMLGVLNSGDELSIRIPPQMAAVILNASDLPAQVAAKIRGGGTLGMRYDGD